MPASFVDIGCGRGEDVRYLAGRGVRAVGLDAVPKSYAGVARELAGNPDAEFQQVNVLEVRALLAVPPGRPGCPRSVPSRCGTSWSCCLAPVATTCGERRG